VAAGCDLRGTERWTLTRSLDIKHSRCDSAHWHKNRFEIRGFRIVACAEAIEVEIVRCWRGAVEKMAYVPSSYSLLMTDPKGVAQRRIFLILICDYSFGDQQTNFVSSKLKIPQTHVMGHVMKIYSTSCQMLNEFIQERLRAALVPLHFR